MARLQIVIDTPWSRRRLTRTLLPFLVAVPLIAWTTELTSSPALASNVTNVKFHVPASVSTNPCFPDDVVNLNGDIHVVITTTANGRDSYRVQHHLNSHLSGVSITTGTKYVNNETSNDRWDASPPFPVVHAQTYDFVLISQGRTPNYVLHMTMRETVDAGNVADATADGWSMDCRG
jgi:hypothetical protein